MTTVAPCPRCGVGTDTDGDGNCRFCGNIPDDRLAAAIVQATAGRPTFPQAFAREAKVQMTSKSHWWELGVFAWYIAIGITAGTLMRIATRHGDHVLTAAIFLLLCTIVLRPLRQRIWGRILPKAKP